MNKSTTNREKCHFTGAQGLVETNKRVRPDRGLQRVFGRDGCAEQSVIGETLHACTPENVEEMYQVRWQPG